MRIAFLTSRMLLGYGVDLTIHEIARRLALRGHSVDVLTPNSDGTYAGASYGIVHLPAPGGPRNRALPLFELATWRQLRAQGQQLRESYDVLVPCTHPYYCAGRACGLPQVFFNFGNVPTTGFTWKGKLNWAWLDFSEDVLHKPASRRVVSISRFLHSQQSLQVQHRGAVVPLGGDHYWPAYDAAPDALDAAASAYDKQALREAFRARHGVPPDAVVLGFCGRLHQRHPAYKGTSEVVALGRRLRERESRVRLLLCGLATAEDRAWIEAAGGQALVNLPPEEMPGYYASLDIYVCASRWEGFNLPILEAAWHGVPAVAYEVGAHSEHACAVLVGELSYDELCRATLTLVRDQRQRAEMGARALELAQRFTWDRAAGLFEQQLELAVR